MYKHSQLLIPPYYDKDEDWEEQVSQNRLKARHILALSKSQYNVRRSEQALGCAKKLSSKMQIWRYIPNGKPPSIELGWIIHSQIAWKGYDIEEEDLWEDLPETDPKRIMELDELGPSIEDLIPAEVRLLLRKILDELELHGINIKKEEFSLNWELPASAAKSSRGKSGLKFDKKSSASNAISKHKSPKSGSGSVGKGSSNAKGKGKTKGKKSTSGLIGSFFGLG